MFVLVAVIYAKTGLGFANIACLSFILACICAVGELLTYTYDRKPIEQCHVFRLLVLKDFDFLYYSVPVRDLLGLQPTWHSGCMEVLLRSSASDTLHTYFLVKTSWPCPPKSQALSKL